MAKESNTNRQKLLHLWLPLRNMQAKVEAPRSLSQESFHERTDL